MGLQNSFRYKNIRVSFLLDIRKGGDVFNGNERYLMSTGLSPRTLDRDTPVIFNGVLRDGRENSDTPTANTIAITPSAQPLNYYAAFPESEFVERDINWVRMRDARIEYQFPKTVLARTKVFQNMSVFVNGTDLFLITNYWRRPQRERHHCQQHGRGRGGFRLRQALCTAWVGVWT